MLRDKKKMILLVLVIFFSVMTSYFLFIQNLIVSFKVEKDLEIIMEPSFSSYAGTYIAKHPKEYNDIIKMGDKSLNYMLNQFEEKDENGLKGYIMAEACKEILGDKNSKKHGEDWYSEYMEDRGK